MLDVMRRRAPLAALLMGVAVAGFLAIGLVQAAGSGPDLGEPVVVSQTPVGSAQSREGRTSEPPATKPTSPEPTSAGPSSPKRTATEPAPTERPAITPSERTAKVEPVRPPSPRPGGGDDDDDDGGDDDD